MGMALQSPNRTETLATLTKQHQVQTESDMYAFLTVQLWHDQATPSADTETDMYAFLTVQLWHASTCMHMHVQGLSVDTFWRLSHFHAALGDSGS